MKKEQPTVNNLAFPPNVKAKPLTERGKQNAKRYYEEYAEKEAQLTELGALGSAEWPREETYVTVKRVKRETS